MEDGKVEMKINDFINLMEEKEQLSKSSDELEEVLTILFNATSLSYDKQELYFGINDLGSYLKIKERHRYDTRLKELQIEEQAKKEKEENQ